MKRIIAIAAAAILCFACAACGCSNSEPVTIPSTRPTIPSTMPSTILPTMETNIPDPEVNDNSTMGADMFEPTDSTGNNDGSSEARNRSMTGDMK